MSRLHEGVQSVLVALWAEAPVYAHKLVYEALGLALPNGFGEVGCTLRERTRHAQQGQGLTDFAERAAHGLAV